MKTFRERLVDGLIGAGILRSPSREAAEAVERGLRDGYHQVSAELGYGNGYRDGRKDERARIEREVEPLIREVLATIRIGRDAIDEDEDAARLEEAIRRLKERPSGELP